MDDRYGKMQTQDHKISTDPGPRTCFECFKKTVFMQGISAPKAINFRHIFFKFSTKIPL